MRTTKRVTKEEREVMRGTWHRARANRLCGVWESSATDSDQVLALLDDADAAEEMRAALVAIGRYEIACDEHDDPHELEDARRAANKADALARRLAEEAGRG